METVFSCFLIFVTYMYNLHFHISAYMFATQAVVSCFIFSPRFLPLYTN